MSSYLQSMHNGREMSGTLAAKNAGFCIFRAQGAVKRSCDRRSDFRSIEWFAPPAAARATQCIISRPFASEQRPK